MGGLSSGLAHGYAPVVAVPRDAALCVLEGSASASWATRSRATSPSSPNYFPDHGDILTSPSRATGRRDRLAEDGSHHDVGDTWASAGTDRSARERPPAVADGLLRPRVDVPFIQDTRDAAPTPAACAAEPPPPRPPGPAPPRPPGPHGARRGRPGAATAADADVARACAHGPRRPGPQVVRGPRRRGRRRARLRRPARQQRLKLKASADDDTAQRHVRGPRPPRGVRG